MAPTTRTRRTGGAESSSRPRKTDSTPDNQRARYQARADRVAARAKAGGTRRSEDATSIAEALDIEREQGRREGRRMPPVKAPVVRYGKFTRQSYGGTTPDPAPRSGPVQVQAPTLGPVPGVTVPMLVDLAIISGDSIVHDKRPPAPSRLLVVFTLFGLLGLAGRAGGPGGARLASGVGWAIVLATFYNTARPGEAPLGVSAFTSLGNFLSGKYANPANIKPTTKSGPSVKSGNRLGGIKGSGGAFRS